MITYIDYIHNFLMETFIDRKPRQTSITIIDQLFKANKKVISITRSKGVAPLFTSSELYFFILSGEEYSLFMNKNKLDVTSLYEL